MSREKPIPQDSYPGFSAQDGVIERDFDPKELSEVEECIACKTVYDSVECRRCPSYAGDLETLLEGMDKDRLNRGEPMRVSK